MDRAANVVSVASVLPATQTPQRKMLNKRWPLQRQSLRKMLATQTRLKFHSRSVRIVLHAASAVRAVVIAVIAVTVASAANVLLAPKATRAKAAAPPHRLMSHPLRHRLLPPSRRRRSL